jgi:CheY-like chemotaxis protein
VSIPPTLLVADDSLAIQRIVTLTFADQPIRLVLAKDGQDAINRMAIDRPDLVLADTNMPCVDGYEVARWVRQQPHLSAVPVLLLAGIADPVDEQRLHDSGANGVLEKPFEPSHVISRVKELLGIKGAAAASSTRLITPDDPKPIKRVLPKPAAQAPASAAPASPGPQPLAFAAPPDRAATEPDPVTEEFSSDHARGTAADWFPNDPAAPRSSAPFGAEFDDPDVSSAAFGADLGDGPAEHAEPPTGDNGAPAGPSASAPTSLPTADVFASLLAAEQSGFSAQGHAAAIAERHEAPLDAFSSPVVDKPQTVPEERQGAPEEELTEAIRQSAAAATRAAVAAAVAASLPGALRDAINEGVGEALPKAVNASIEAHLGAAVAAAVADSVGAAVPPAVEGAVREVVGSRLEALVTGTLEREVRDSIAPEVHRAVREMVAAALPQAIADAVSATVPGAIVDAMRHEVASQVRGVLIETAERLVGEEIARLRDRRG